MWNDAVNTYLQTIGKEVKRKIFQDGISYEFVVVSGYEEGRGNWATTHNNEIRFGDKTYPVQGLNYSLILTPNFFYGENKEGEEIEYRLGLVKDQDKVRIHPVLLKKHKNQIQAKVIRPLCVVTRGLNIDKKNAANLGRKELEKLTAYQQFLSCFWNIDDYLRKQNSEFHSDFDTEVWEAIEVFSGRIIDQILGIVAYEFRKDPSWIIPQLEDVYSKSLIVSIEESMNASSEISENQILTQVANLCSFIHIFNKTQAFDELEKKELNIIPYIFKNFQSSDIEIKFEALRVFQIALEKSPKFLDPEIADKVWELLQENCKRKTSLWTWREADAERQWLLKFYQIIWEKRRELVPEQYRQLVPIESTNLKKFNNKLDWPHNEDILNPLSDYGLTIMLGEGGKPWLIWIKQELIDILMEYCLDSTKIMDGIKKCSSYLKGSWLERELNSILYNMISALRIAFKDTPKLLNQERVVNLINLCRKYKSEEIKWIAKEMYKKAADQRPELISKTIPIIFAMFSNNDDQVREIAVYLYKKIIEKAPNLITNECIEKILELCSDSSEKVQWAAAGAYRAAIRSTSHLIDQKGITKIIEFLSAPSWILRKLALEALNIILEKLPNLVDKEVIKHILLRRYDSRKSVKVVACTAYRTAIIQYPQFFNQEEIRQFIADLTSYMVNYKNYRSLEKFAGANYNIVPILIDNFKSSDKRVRFNAVSAYREFFTKFPEYVGQTSVDSLCDLLLDPVYSVKKQVLITYGAIIKNKPELVGQTGIDRISDVFTNLEEKKGVIIFQELEKKKDLRKTALNIYKIAYEKVPQFIKSTTIKKIHQRQLSEDKDYSYEVFSLYEIILEKTPHLLELPIIIEMFSDNTYRGRLFRQKALETYKSIIKSTPKLLDQLLFQKILELCSLEYNEANDDTLRIALYALDFALQINPNLLDNGVIKTIQKAIYTPERGFSLSKVIIANVDVKLPAIKAYLTAMKIDPNILNQEALKIVFEIFNMIGRAGHSMDNAKEAAFGILNFAFKKRSHLFTPEIIENISKLRFDVSSTKLRNLKQSLSYKLKTNDQQRKKNMYRDRRK
ncbi:MAG: hypothetical protein ACFFD2_13670 [Promethearchaeota archaeon]